jgi:tRNA G37 N-methylase Trm5
MMEINYVSLKYGLQAKLINSKEVKSYAPNVNHVVLDVKITH